MSVSRVLGCLLLLLGSELGAQGGVVGVGLRAGQQLIKPGDRIELKFMRDVELNSILAVSERGEAVFPKLGTIQLAATSIGALRDTLTMRYNEYLRGAELQVTVLRRVVVNGQVRVPDVYYLDITSSVRDAIAKAGGTLDAANKRKVTIVRGTQRMRARGWETSTGPENDVQSGDQIIVGKQAWLALNALPVISTSVIVIGLIRSLKS